MRGFGHLSCVPYIHTAVTISLRTPSSTIVRWGVVLFKSLKLRGSVRLADAESKRQWHGGPLVQRRRTADVATTDDMQQAEQHDTFAHACWRQVNRNRQSEVFGIKRSTRQ